MSLLRTILPLLILAGLLALAYRCPKNRHSVLPLPYRTVDINPLDENRLKNSLVLIVGDKNTANFDPILRLLEDELVKKAGGPVGIYNTGLAHEGLHRTLARIKNIKQCPKVIIYHGASEELYERKFVIKDIPVILKNISVYNDGFISKLIHQFPFISCACYRPVNHLNLADINPDERALLDSDHQLLLPVAYKLFELELEELLGLALRCQSQLILLTTPLALDAPPTKICESSSTISNREVLKEAAKLLSQAKTTEAQAKLTNLATEFPDNAMVHYLLGQTYRALGKFDEAKNELELTRALDCAPAGATSIHNIILRRFAASKNVTLVDLDALVNSYYGKRVLFTPAGAPDPVFYEGLIPILVNQISPSFNTPRKSP
jgi:tetratricopeptide (TPR) repeat protein